MSTPDESSILVLIPAHNEAGRVGRVVLEARKQLPVLVVDDGSSDQTAAEAEDNGATVYRQTPNQGKGVALQSGFRRAIEMGYAAVVALDADGQHDPAEIPRFLEAYHTQAADLVIGERDFNRIPPVRRLANWLGRWSFSWAVGQPVRDNQSGYRLISRRMMQACLESQERGFEFEVEMIVICLQRGYRLDWVPIRTIYAGENSHIQPLRHVVQFTRMIYKARKKRY